MSSSTYKITAKKNVRDIHVTKRQLHFFMVLIKGKLLGKDKLKRFKIVSKNTHLELKKDKSQENCSQKKT